MRRVVPPVTLNTRPKGELSERDARKMAAAGRKGWSYWVKRDGREVLGFFETPLSDKSFIQKIKDQIPGTSEHQYHG